MKSASTTKAVVHSWPVRLTHWVNALALLVMVLSGWRIYNASPLFDNFRFPETWTLGGWLAGALMWHFAMMWLLIFNGAIYLFFGIITGRFAKRFFPITKAQLFTDFRLASRLTLKHDAGTYNTIQRIAYLGAIALIALLVMSGLAIWKPVQLQALANLMGGYEGARLTHFVAMSLLVAFVVIHVFMALITPKILLSMITGNATIAANAKSSPSGSNIPSTESGDAL